MSYGRKCRHREELEKAIHEYVGSYNERRTKLEFDRLSIN
ncbi:IS3 family transposase [Corynebacterium marquesiae]|nr:IS3 family transposase [Corynebacterium marquesiae]MDK8495110.1 IS3 family transposase [Corynebacterium marquesiae]